MANISELLNGWGFGKQTAIGTANLVATMWRHTNLNTKPWAKVPVNEDDRAEIGKGHEFPTQLFKSHYNRSEEHTSELQSLRHLVCRLLLEKKEMYRKRLHHIITQAIEHKAVLAPCKRLEKPGFFFFNVPAPTDIHILPHHHALPI